MFQKNEIKVVGFIRRSSDPSQPGRVMGEKLGLSCAKLRLSLVILFYLEPNFRN